MRQPRLESSRGYQINDLDGSSQELEEMCGEVRVGEADGSGDAAAGAGGVDGSGVGLNLTGTQS
jgi:hypothetical protein